MTALERLGLEVVAFDLLGSRAMAATLLMLLDGNGRQVGFEALASARQWRKSYNDVPTVAGLRTRICVLRSALADLGLPGVIKTCGVETVKCPAVGYALPEPGRSRVMARLMEEVEG
jgi:hypothetical protein